MTNKTKTGKPITHLKRDGGWLCGKQDSTWHNKRNFNTIKFSHAHKIDDLSKHPGICKACVKRYYEILEKQKNPVIV
jgi:hypothetical protein